MENLLKWMHRYVSPVFLALLGLEMIQKSLTTLWFAGGALAAAAAAFLYAGMKGQLMCFVTVSFLLLLAVRPAVILAGRADRGSRRSKGRMHGVTTGLE